MYIYISLQLQTPEAVFGVVFWGLFTPSQRVFGALGIMLDDMINGLDQYYKLPVLYTNGTSIYHLMICYVYHCASTSEFHFLVAPWLPIS